MKLQRIANFLDFQYARKGGFGRCHIFTTKGRFVAFYSKFQKMSLGIFFPNLTTLSEAFCNFINFVDSRSL